MKMTNWKLNDTEKKVNFVEDSVYFQNSDVLNKEKLKMMTMMMMMMMMMMMSMMKV